VKYYVNHKVQKRQQALHFSSPKDPQGNGPCTFQKAKNFGKGEGAHEYLI
jgi:hypothetical protein